MSIRPGTAIWISRRRKKELDEIRASSGGAIATYDQAILFLILAFSPAKVGRALERSGRHAEEFTLDELNQFRQALGLEELPDA